MKKKNIFIIIISVVIVILILCMLLMVIKPANKESKKTNKVSSEEKLQNVINNFKNSNYSCELLYSVNDPNLPDVHYKRLLYHYKGDIEEYYNESFNYEYDDFKHKAIYNKYNDSFTKNNLQYNSNHIIIYNLLKNVALDKYEKPIYYLKATSEDIKDFFNNLSKRDNTIMPFIEGKEYYVMLNIKNKNISWFSIMEQEDTSKYITYTFNDINKTEDIKLPEVKKNDDLKNDNSREPVQ